ncbi:hypothetical protein [Sanyastnella coralliicola]|uniref:hypothetical protein n=1 Tax=Sanyastnella coralliicola TaxID=3069118 RepID=UPI0027B8B3E7|nr:hypothetical protein [Longitalea sp. SCSIO 12813]
MIEVIPKGLPCTILQNIKCTSSIGGFTEGEVRECFVQQLWNGRVCIYPIYGDQKHRYKAFDSVEELSKYFERIGKTVKQTDKQIMEHGVFDADGNKVKGTFDERLAKVRSIDSTVAKDVTTLAGLVEAEELLKIA